MKEGQRLYELGYWGPDASSFVVAVVPGEGRVLCLLPAPILDADLVRAGNIAVDVEPLEQARYGLCQHPPQGCLDRLRRCQQESRSAGMPSQIGGPWKCPVSGGSTVPGQSGRTDRPTGWPRAACEEDTGPPALTRPVRSRAYLYRPYETDGARAGTASGGSAANGRLDYGVSPWRREDSCRARPGHPSPGTGTRRSPCPC